MKVNQPFGTNVTSQLGIGHFRVAVSLIMKARLSAKAFHMKISCLHMNEN